jgi:hypothetical protein
MTIRGKRNLVEAGVLLAVLATWAVFTHTTTFRIKTVLAEAAYPKSQHNNPDMSTRLRLLAGMSWPNSRNHADMAMELAGMGESAVPTLAEAFRQGPNASASECLAGSSLRRIGAPAVAPVVAMLQAPDNGTESRMRAATLLRNLGPAAKSAAPQVLQVVNEPSGYIRFAALQALATIDPPTALARGLPIVREELSHPKSDTERWWAKYALFEIGAVTPESRALIEQELAKGQYAPAFAKWVRTHKPGEDFP